MLFVSLVILALLGLGLIAAVVVAISTRHVAAIIAAILLALILFLTFVYPGKLRLAIWPPTAEAAPYVAAPPAAPLAPVAGSCNRDGQTVADNPNAVRTAMSYFGGTSEPCIFYGEVNFGLTSNGRGLTVLMVIPPQWTLNVNGMLGYAFWARESQGAVDWSISDSTANLTRSDGRAEATPLVIHVDNEAEMATLTSLVRAVYPSFAYKLIPPALP